jgi:hypothetical protein
MVPRGTGGERQTGLCDHAEPKHFPMNQLLAVSYQLSANPESDNFLAYMIMPVPTPGISKTT